RRTAARPGRSGTARAVGRCRGTARRRWRRSRPARSPHSGRRPTLPHRPGQYPQPGCTSATGRVGRSARRAGIAVYGPRVRILLVEDDNRVATALGAVLGRHGFHTIRVGGVAEALERLDNRVDVVLVDLGLPDGDGFDLIYSIRAARDVPIIVV